MQDMFPHTVTVYNVSIEEDQETFTEERVNNITILQGVLLDAVKGSNVVSSGLEGADSVTLYIPKSVTAIDGATKAEKTYLNPLDYWRSGEKSSYWTLSPTESTFFVKGEVVEPELTAQKIEAAYDHVYNVTKVDFKDFGDEMSHWEVGGA